MNETNSTNAKNSTDCHIKNSKDICDEYCVHKDNVQAAEHEMPPLDTLFSLAELFKMFGDSTRIRIMCALFGRELCVCDICELLNMGQSAVSHQLRLLRTASLVKVRREGKSAYYSLDDEHIHIIFKLGLEHIQEQKTKGGRL
ncbi:MAG: ArsR/SmtB family transcription factor [Acutalibacteraceae bacterium]